MLLFGAFVPRRQMEMSLSAEIINLQRYVALVQFLFQKILLLCGQRPEPASTTRCETICFIQRWDRGPKEG